MYCTFWQEESVLFETIFDEILNFAKDFWNVSKIRMARRKKRKFLLGVFSNWKILAFSNFWDSRQDVTNFVLTFQKILEINVW